MKKELILLIFILLNIQVSLGQEIPKLKLTPNGVEPIVVKVSNMNADKLYNRSINWVKDTYENPEIVLKAKIENKKIRLNGFTENAYWYKALGIKYYGNLNYSLIVEFKDERYRFNLIIDKKDLVFYERNFFKKGKIRKAGKDAVPALEDTLNNLSKSFYNYITGKSEKDNNDW